MIKGPHRAWECDRCRTSFKTEKEKINHNREETACRLVTEAHIEAEGIHQHHVEWLRAKGKSYTEAAGKRYSQQTEEERWITIYKELFSCSDDAVPNPCKSCCFIPPNQYLTGYDHSDRFVSGANENRF